MTKLLSDEELRDELHGLLSSANYTGILKLIKSQNIAHADMVIGEDEDTEALMNSTLGVVEVRNNLRSEQRERNR